MGMVFASALTTTSSHSCNTILTQPSGPLGVKDDENLRF